MPAANTDSALQAQRDGGLETILATRGLTKRFAGFTAVNNLDLSIRRGAVHALIGPNGAGKTTVFNLLSKFLAPSSGQIFFKGEDITGVTPAEIACRGLVRSFQISAVFAGMSVLDNVRIALQRPAGLANRFWRSTRVLSRLDNKASELIDAVGLSKDIATKVGELSYGKKRALELATTLALEPEVLLLDEPMAGLGQEDVGRVAAVIKAAAVGRTVVMVEHNLSVVSELCDSVTVLQRGEILAAGSYAEVSGDARVREAYMGSDHV